METPTLISQLASNVTSGITMITSGWTSTISALVANEALVTFIGIGLAMLITAFACSFIPKLKHRRG